MAGRLWGVCQLAPSPGEGVISSAIIYVLRFFFFFFAVVPLCFLKFLASFH